VAILEVIRQELTAQYHSRRIQRRMPDFPREAVIPLDAAVDVLLLGSRIANRDPQVYIAEVAFAHELAARHRPFAATADPSLLFEKSVTWFLPRGMISPPLWNYSRQAHEFAKGLEAQGNRLFCSSNEVLYWENKAYMHQRFADLDIPTPQTNLLTRETWPSTPFDVEPLLIKEEHSAGSSGIHYFQTATEARTFVANYRFRPEETLIMQAVVSGATQDLRVTLVGGAIIPSASYWRRKRAAALSSGVWTSTATTYDSLVDHAAIPPSVHTFVAECLEKLDLRMAAFDLIWEDDDVKREPLVLEVSPYFQPNPPKPARYRDWTYKRYKQMPYAEEGYFSGQYGVFRSISRQILEQEMF
jgi:glutathione synthase/RimK-type ligase-like ATP-grasp enzyme